VGFFFAALLQRSGSIRDNLEYINTLFTIDFLISSFTLVVLFVVAFVFPQKFDFKINQQWEKAH